MILLMCQHCRRPSALEEKFCSDCGTELQRRECPSCSAANDVDSSYCHGCGAALRPAAASVAIEQEPATVAAEIASAPLETGSASSESASAPPEPASMPPETPSAATGPAPAGSEAMLPRQRADGGDLRFTDAITVVPLNKRPVSPPSSVDPPSIADILSSISALHATARVEATTAGADAFSTRTEPARPPSEARSSRYAWLTPFFVSMASVGTMAFTAMVLLFWPASAPSTQATKRVTQQSLGGAANATPRSAADAAADAAAAAAARLLESTPERAARGPNVTANDAIDTPPAQASVRPSAATAFAPPAPSVPATRPANAVVSPNLEPPANPIIAPPVAAPVPPAAAEVPRSTRTVRPTSPPPVLLRECTAAMEALALCPPGSKRSGS